MNLEKLYNVLQLLNVAGIRQANLIKTENSILVCAADDLDEGEEMPSVVVVHDIGDDFVPISMGIQRVPVLLKRMELFGLEGLKETHTETEEFMRVITLKEGRRKTTYTFSDPKTINVPDGVVDENIVKQITITKNYVNQLTKANSAMGSKILTLESINKEIVLKLYDDISDAYSEVLEESDGGEWSFNWKTNSVLKLLKHAVKIQDEVVIEVGDVGILYMNVGILRFMVMPQVI